MSSNYFGKVVAIKDDFSVVVNVGSDAGVKEGQKFLVLGLGEVITDPDTGLELERLEIIKGKVMPEHIQKTITTLKSCVYDKRPDQKEIKKTTQHGTLFSLSSLGRFNEPPETVSEIITPGESYLQALENVKIGDVIVRTA